MSVRVGFQSLELSPLVCTFATSNLVVYVKYKVLIYTSPITAALSLSKAASVLCIGERYQRSYNKAPCNSTNVSSSMEQRQNE